MAEQARRAVVVVDDDPAGRDSLRFMLETAGHVVETFASGAEFLAGLRADAILCLVLDERMPRPTGLEVLARLRGEGHTVPVLFVTGAPSATLRRRAAELGAVAVLEKPLAQEDVLACVASASRLCPSRKVGGKG